MSKKLSKYIDPFDYIDKTWISLSAISGGITTISFTSVIRVNAAISSTSFTLLFSLTKGLIKKLLPVTRKKKILIKLSCLLKANKIVLKL